MAKADLTVSRLRELLTYDPSTGHFSWLVSRTNVAMGRIAGCVNPRGYIHVTIDRKQHKAHRLAWLYMTGEWPSAQIDHLDNDRANNAWRNLRDVDQATNQQNQRSCHRINRSGVMGASLLPSGKWRGQITVFNRRIHLGTFDTAELAGAAYVAAKRMHHPGCTI